MLNYPNMERPEHIKLQGNPLRIFRSAEERDSQVTAMQKCLAIDAVL